MDFLFNPQFPARGLNFLRSVCPQYSLSGRCEVESDASSCLKHICNHPYCNTYPLPLTLAAGDMDKQPGYLDLPALIFILNPGWGKNLHLTKLSNRRRFFTSLHLFSSPLELISLEGTQVDVFLNGFDFITLLNDLARYLLDGELPRGAWPINV